MAMYLLACACAVPFDENEVVSITTSERVPGAKPLDRFSPVEALVFAGLSKEHAAGLVSEANKVNVVFACAQNKPAYGLLQLRRAFEFDDVSEELAEAVFLFGMEGLIEWDQACANLPGESARPVSLPAVPTRRMATVECISEDGFVYVFDSVDQARELNITLPFCLAEKVRERHISWVCEDADLSVCTSDGAFDYTVLDALKRQDCGAWKARADVGEYGLAALDELIEECSQRRRLPYASDCPGSTSMVGYDTAFHMVKTASDSSLRLHIRGGGTTGVRGVMWTNKRIQEYGVMPCESGTCTTSTSMSCWPRPRWNAGSHSVYSRLAVYACNWQDATTVHVSGNFRGWMRFQGTLVSTSGSACTVRLDGLNVYVEASTLSFCNVYIQLGGLGFQTTDATLRNGC
jgi:hypothetical protein